MSHTPCNNSSLANLLSFFGSCNRFIAWPGVVVEAGNAPPVRTEVLIKALLLILLSVFIYASSFGAKIVVYDAKGRNDSTEDCDGFTDYDSNRDAAGLHDSAKRLTFVHHSFALRCRQGHIRKCGGRGRQRATSCRFIGLYLAASTRVLSAKYAGALRRAWSGIGHGLACPCFGASGVCRLLGRDVVVKGWDSFGKCTKSFSVWMYSFSCVSGEVRYRPVGFSGRCFAFGCIPFSGTAFCRDWSCAPVRNGYRRLLGRFGRAGIFLYLRINHEDGCTRCCALFCLVFSDGDHHCCFNQDIHCFFVDILHPALARLSRRAGRRCGLAPVGDP